MKHLLIDFENIQPPNLDNLVDKAVTIWLFLGVTQKSLPVELVVSLLKLEQKIKLIQLNKTGKNALDFYLSYYLGKIIAQDPEAEIEILSRDGGYDVLLEHILAERQAKSVERSILLPQNMPQAAFSAPKPTALFTPDQATLAKVQKLFSLSSRPISLTSLSNAIKSHTKCDPKTAQQIIDYLQRTGRIKLQNEKIHYR